MSQGLTFYSCRKSSCQFCNDTGWFDPKVADADFQWIITRLVRNASERAKNRLEDRLVFLLCTDTRWVAVVIQDRVAAGDDDGAGRCLRDKLLNEEIFDTLDDARCKISLWRYDYNAFRPHSSLGNLTPLETRRTLALLDGFAPGALALKPPTNYQFQTGRLSL